MSELFAHGSKRFALGRAQQAGRRRVGEKCARATDCCVHAFTTHAAKQISAKGAVPGVGPGCAGGRIDLLGREAR